MKTAQPIAITTVAATAALTRMRFVAFNGAPAAASVRALGVAEVDADLGEQAPIMYAGIALVEAGAAIAQGAMVTTDATARAVTNAAPTLANHCGFALDAASAAGDVIRVMLA